MIELVDWVAASAAPLEEHLAELHMKAQISLLLLAGFALLTACRQGGASSGEESRNAEFAKSMSGASLVGRSTTRGREGLSGEETYHFEKVTHLTGDTWIFQTRLRYGGRDIPVPVPLSVKWAGDTPVITLTDVSIPGVGTYSARVLLYRDQYAGTWSGKNVGGQLFGRIVPAPAAAASTRP